MDIHAKNGVACARIGAEATVTYEHRTVSTNTRELLELADRLSRHTVTHVAIAYASHCTSVGRCETFSNAYFYRTSNGAHVGDLFMSLIHTCELAGVKRSTI